MEFTNVQDFVPDSIDLGPEDAEWMIPLANRHKEVMDAWIQEHAAKLNVLPDNSPEEDALGADKPFFSICLMDLAHTPMNEVERIKAELEEAGISDEDFQTVRMTINDGYIPVFMAKLAETDTELTLERQQKFAIATAHAVQMYWGDRAQVTMLRIKAGVAPWGELSESDMDKLRAHYGVSADFLPGGTD